MPKIQTWADWLEMLNQTKPMTPNSRFPDRPTSDGFVLLSRVARTLDMIAETNEDSIDQLCQLVGLAVDEMAYLAKERAVHSLDRVEVDPDVEGFDRQVTGTFMQAAWMDGWMHGAMFAGT